MCQPVGAFQIVDACNDIVVQVDIKYISRIIIQKISPKLTHNSVRTLPVNGIFS